jgi:hypothetical protein
MSLRALLRLLRRSPREAQLRLLERVQQHYLTQQASYVAYRVASSPPVALAYGAAQSALATGRAARRGLALFRARLHDATVGRVQRSLPYRCAAAYVRMIAADARVAAELHRHCATADIPLSPQQQHGPTSYSKIHSSTFISSTTASCSLAPLPPDASTLSAIGWRTRRLVFSLARFTGQARRLIFSRYYKRSPRHWPLDALSLWFQLLLLYLPTADREYDAVRESMLDCLRWYELPPSSQSQSLSHTSSRASSSAQRIGEWSPSSSDPNAAPGQHTYRPSSGRVQVEGVQDSFLAELSSPAHSVSPVRLLHAPYSAAAAAPTGGHALTEAALQHMMPHHRPRMESSCSDFFETSHLVEEHDDGGAAATNVAAGAAANTDAQRPQQAIPLLQHMRVSTSSADFHFASSEVSTPACSPPRRRGAGGGSGQSSYGSMQPTSASPVTAAAVSAAAAAASHHNFLQPHRGSLSSSPPRSSHRPHLPHHGRSATSLGSSFRSSTSSRGGGHGTSLSMSLETSHSRVLYSRALELIARAGIDLNDVSMDDSINDAQLLAADEEAGIEQGAHPNDGDGDDSDVSNGSASWDRHSASAREIVFPAEEAEVDVSSSTYSSDADTVSVQSKRSAAAAARKIGAELSVAELLEHVEAAHEHEREPGEEGDHGHGGVDDDDVHDDEEVHGRLLRSLSAPQLRLPVFVHASTHLLCATQSVLAALHPLLSHLCTSHRVRIDVRNDELRSWNDELPLGAAANASASTAAAAAAMATAGLSSSAAAAASSGNGSAEEDEEAPLASSSDVHAPAVHLFVHDLLPSQSAVEALVASLQRVEKQQQYQQQQPHLSLSPDSSNNFFLALLVPSALVASTSAAAASAWAVGVLEPYASRSALLRRALERKHVALVATAVTNEPAASASLTAPSPSLILPISTEGEGAAQQERLLLLADAVLRVAEEGLMAHNRD